MTTDLIKKYPAISRVVTPVTLVVAALLCLLMMISYFLLISYQHAIFVAESETRNLVGVIESRLSSEFSRVDGMLTFMTNEVQSDPLHSRSSAEKTQQLFRTVTRFPQLAGMFVFDADGTMQMTSDPGVKPFSVADRSHFQTLRDRPQTSLVFSEPLMSRSTGKLSLVQARSIHDDAGRFLGTVNAILPIDAFSALFRDIDVGKDGVILLRRSDNFKLIACIPHNHEKDFNQPIPANNPIRQRIESGDKQGTLLIASSDGVQRIASFATLDNRFPFYAQVSFAEAHYLAAWRNQVMWMGLLFVLLLMAFGIALVRLTKSNLQVALASRNLLYKSNLDMTDLIQSKNLLAEQVNALKLSETQMTTSQRIGGVGSCVYDFNTDIVRASTQMLRLFGFPTDITDHPLDNFLACLPQHCDLVRQTLAGKFGFPSDIADYPLDDFLAGIPEHDPIRQSLTDLINQSHQYEAEFTIQPVDGSPTKVVHAIGKIERDSHGTPIKIFGFIQNITERKAVEAKLAKLLADQDAFLQSEVVGFAIVSHRVMRCMNRAMAKMLGYEAHELGGLSARVLYQNDDAFETFGRDAYGEINAGRVFHRQCQLCHKNGSLKWFDISSARLPSDHEATIWAFVDISPLKLTEAELRQAKIAADSANVTKSRFLATMSHEIRTPMNGILGMAQLLLMPNLTDSERHEYVKTIFSSGQTLLALLNDILDLSKIEAGKFQLDTIVFEPDLILHDTQMLFSGAANAKGLQLECQWNGLPGRRYLSDAYRIRQMLSNLVGNAIKFTKNGCVRIEGVETEQDGESAMLEFSVSDTGIGIPPDKIDLLFKPFSQTNSSTTREFGGSGLGLSIVLHLARLMGGDVGVESVADKGSRFWFRVRAKQVAQFEATSGSECVVPASVVTESAWLSGHVLVVEDNVVNRMVIESLLTKLGVSVTLAHDGQQALDTLTQGDGPDLVLMDLHMPIMDGYDATEQIRQWERGNNRPRLPIIALTANAYEEDRQHCLSIGMNDFLTKPIALDTLKSALTKWLPISC